MAAMTAHVWVMLKSTVLDPQGAAIQHALAGLGHKAVRDVRQGKFFVLKLEGLDRAAAQAEVETHRPRSSHQPGDRGVPLRNRRRRPPGSRGLALLLGW